MTSDILDLISQSSKKVLFLYNLQTKQFDYLSPTIEAIWGEGRDNILESPGLLLSHIDPDDQQAVIMRFEKACSGTACEIEFSIRLPGGMVKQVKVHAHPVFSAPQEVSAIAGEAEDITAQAQYLDYLLEFGRKKNSVLMIVAHDLQGPLAILKNTVSLLEAEFRDRNYEEIRTYLEILNLVYEDSTRLIKDVLQDEHLKSISVAVNRTRFDVVEKVKQTMAAFIKSKLVKTAIQINSAEEKMMVELDEMKFTQILNNLITNSIKFTPPEGSITITVARQGENLLLTHADTGIGIPEALQPYLFDKHSKKAQRPGLNGEESNGIGLTLIKDLVELQGGKIWVESEENKGTTFYVSFPLPA